ncbi:MAG: hypothetical protein ACNA8H_11625, partial [Anaerolineales bacterium]
CGCILIQSFFRKGNWIMASKTEEGGKLSVFSPASTYYSIVEQTSCSRRNKPSAFYPTLSKLVLDLK